MKALTRMTTLLNYNLLALLTQKIEKCVLDNVAICVSLSGSCVTCRNRMNIEDYEVDTEHLYLNDNNFEVHINFDNSTSIEYDDYIDECFTIMQGSMKLNLYFM